MSDIDLEVKAVMFGWMLVAVYGIHQVTVGGDGVVLASIAAAVCTIGGYSFGAVRSVRREG